jgi:Xaa-Pro aminopeptidase
MADIARLSDDELQRMRRYRHDRLRHCMENQDVPALLMYDPVNIRYATDARNMQVYSLNHDARYVLMAAGGHTVLFDWFQGEVYFGGLLIDEVRIGQSYGYVANGDADIEASLVAWAAEIADWLHIHSPDDLRLGIDRLSPFAAQALAREGITVIDGQQAIYEARAMKSADEITAMRIAVAACDEGFKRMRSHTQPGLTEVELWSHLHQANIEWEGEWINARLMTSGTRTNPWSQETSLRVVQPGDIVACDSDLIGPYGYGSDISRTWLASGNPTDRQRRLYAQSYEHLQKNVSLFQPGASFLDIAHTNYRLPVDYQEQMFTSFAHGIGLENEWPIIKSVHKMEMHGGYGGGYDGELKPGMTICVESYIGEVGGPDGVKLEEQILITSSGPVPLSATPFEEEWL